VFFFNGNGHFIYMYLLDYLNTSRFVSIRINNYWVLIFISIYFTVFTLPYLLLISSLSVEVMLLPYLVSSKGLMFGFLELRSWVGREFPCQFGLVAELWKLQRACHWVETIVWLLELIKWLAFHCWWLRDVIPYFQWSACPYSKLPILVEVQDWVTSGRSKIRGLLAGVRTWLGNIFGGNDNCLPGAPCCIVVFWEISSSLTGTETQWSGLAAPSSLVHSDTWERFLRRVILTSLGAGFVLFRTGILASAFDLWRWKRLRLDRRYFGDSPTESKTCSWLDIVSNSLLINGECKNVATSSKKRTKAQALPTFAAARQIKPF